MQTDYRPGQRRRRNNRGRRPNAGPRNQTKVNPILAFFQNLFGLKKKPAPQPRRFEDEGRNREDRPNRNDRGPRRDRNDRGNRGERGERGGRQDQGGGQDRRIRSDAEAPMRQEGFVSSEVEVGEEPPFREPREERAPREEREPSVPLEVTTPRLYIGNLSYDCSESDLFELFTQAGQVRNVEIARDREGHRSKGFGFVEMESIDIAKAAQERMNGYELMGRPLLVNGAKGTGGGDRGERRGRDGDRRGRR